MSTEDKTIEEKVEALLAKMTLEEKIGQMSQVRHFDDIKKGDVAKKFIGSVIHTDGPSPGEDAVAWQAKFRELQEEALSTRLGIPLLLGVDAVHGQNTFPGATIFPHNIGMGATNNAFLVQDAAGVTAKEVLATGLNWTFSPCIAVPYNERWGRVYEAFSESTEVTEQMARASVRGHQGNLADPNTIMATAKHYVGDGATDYGKEGGPTTLTRQEVLERLLPPYRAAVEEGVGAIMASFNTLHGVAMHAHKEMITDTLKGAMGFDGIVMTDWKGYSRFGKNDIVNAGVDMFMAVDGDLDVFQNGLKEAVESGEVKQERIDDAVRRILRQKFRLGLFDNPFPNERLISTIGSPEHRDVARQAVRESLVLLKRENKALPIAKNTSKIVVVGEHANNTGLQSGGWTVSWQGKAENYPGATTILQGIQEQAQGEVIYDADGTGGHEDADVAIIVVGETPYAEFFGDIKHDHSREEYGYTLSEQQHSYISAYAGKGPKVVVVLISGRPLVVTHQIEQSDAFIAAWLPGSEGDGIAEVLFGDHNFKGRLPHSWPKAVEDVQGRFGPNFWDDSIQPLYEFGYGLEY
ncbi:MAG: glycoside hydrolase family 3 N-terminal domain-containing protein [Bacteroidota bacterium]